MNNALIQQRQHQQISSNNMPIMNIMTQIALNYLQNDLLKRMNYNVNQPQKMRKEASSLNLHLNERDDRLQGSQNSRKSSIDGDMELHDSFKREENQYKDFGGDIKKRNKQIHNQNIPPNYNPSYKNNKTYHWDQNDRSRSRSKEKQGGFFEKRTLQKNQRKTDKKTERSKKRMDKYKNNFRNSQGKKKMEFIIFNRIGELSSDI